jgi:hypothetical protein
MTARGFATANQYEEIFEQNSVKLFAASESLELVKDLVWLAKVTNALNQHRQNKNAAPKKRPGEWFAGRSFLFRAYLNWNGHCGRTW